MRRCLWLLLLFALAGCGSPEEGDGVLVTPPRDTGNQPTRALPTPRPSPEPTQKLPPTIRPTITPAPTWTPLPTHG